MLILMCCVSLFASSKDVYCWAHIGAQGAINDTLGSVVAQADVTGKLGLGGFLDYRNVLYGDFSYTHKVFEKQYSRFTNVPGYSQMCLGFGWLYRGDTFLFSLDGGVSIAKVGTSWETGAYAEVTPKFIITSFDTAGHVALGFPVQFVYTGNTIRYSIGTAISWEIYNQ